MTQLPKGASFLQVVQFDEGPFCVEEWKEDLPGFMAAILAQRKTVDDTWEDVSLAADREPKITLKRQGRGTKYRDVFEFEWDLNAGMVVGGQNTRRPAATESSNPGESGNPFLKRARNKAGRGTEPEEEKGSKAKEENDGEGRGENEKKAKEEQQDATDNAEKCIKRTRRAGRA